MLLVIESASKIRRSMLVVLDPMEPHPVACSHDLRLAGPLLGVKHGSGDIFNKFTEHLVSFQQLLRVLRLSESLHTASVGIRTWYRSDSLKSLSKPAAGGESAEENA